MAGRLNKVSAVAVASRILQCEAQGMVNGAGGNFVIAHKPWKDRQPRCIRRSPTPWPLLIILQIPDRLRIRGPGSIAKCRIKGLIQHASIAIQQQDMLVADVVGWTADAISGCPFDRCGARERGRSNIAFAGIRNHVDWNQGLRA